MYSIYKIKQLDKLVFSTYHTLNNGYSDQTKLDLIINSPVTPYYLVDAYFRYPDQFSITLHQDNVPNALEASFIVKTLNNTINNTINTNTVALKPKRKPRTKKVKVTE